MILRSDSFVFGCHCLTLLYSAVLQVRTCTINDLSVQAKIETEVKLQLMESALEAVSLHSMMDTHTPGCAVKTVECATGTEDLLQPQPEECPQTDQNIGNDSQQILSVNSEVDSEKLALQLEVRKLRHQLIVSQISAKQFQSECLLYKTKTKSNAKTSMKKKRKDFSLSSNIPQGPTRQCARFSSGPDTPRQALASIENKLRLPGFNESIRKRSTKGENNCERKPTSTAAHSVNIIDASDTFSGICLRM